MTSLPAVPAIPADPDIPAAGGQLAVSAPSLTADTYAARRTRLRPLLAAAECDAALITDLINVRYLTGFSGSNGAAIVSASDPSLDALATDGRYTERAQVEAPGIELAVTRALVQVLIDRAAAAGVVSLGYEETHVTVAQFDGLAAAVQEARLRVRRLGRPVEHLRMVKDEAEIALLREACAIGDRALADVLPTIHAGITEREVARRLEAAMIAHGADDKGFDTIAAGGPNSAIPHHDPTDRPVEAGEFLKLDFGSRYRGYHSDMTRTFVVGREPADWQREIFDIERDAQRAGRHALAPGAALAAVDAASRNVITDAGYGENFGHGLGHGVGLQIHEDPYFAASSDGVLLESTVITVEPGIYLPGRGGVRIEDTLVVRAGGPELLTTAPKDLIVIG